MKFLRLLALFAAPLAAQSVYVFSLDGLGQEILDKDPAARQLRVIQKIRAAGVQAKGVQAAFPSNTANSHAALFTGAYGDVSQITANDEPVVPRGEHTFTEKGNGFRANQLAAEPLWVTAARQNVRNLAYEVTQAIPFGANNTHPGALVFNSYQTKLYAPHTALRARDVEFEPVAGWSPPMPKSSRVRRGFHWKSGELTFYGAILDNAIWVASSKTGRQNRMRVTPKGTETDMPLNRTLARNFGGPLRLVQPTPAAVYFRLFELAEDGADFLLYHSPVQEIGLVDGATAAEQLRDEMLHKAGGVVGSGATRLMWDGAFGSVNLNGSDDTALRRYLETAELSIRQNLRQTRFLAQHFHPRLTLGYLPFPDEFDHQWLAQARQNNTQAVHARQWGYEAIDIWAAGIESLAGKNPLLFVSDHGMAPMTKAVSVNAALKRAGLDGQAVHVYNSVLLNTSDWKGGSVSEQDKPSVLKRVQDTLAALKSPEDNQPIFTAFYDAARDGDKFGIHCAACSDLYFDLAPEWVVRDDSRGSLFPASPRPGGAHGFMPLRDDMLAICVGRGGKLPKALQWPQIRSIDIAPLVTQLLGIQPPKHSRGKSPLN